MKIARLMIINTIIVLQIGCSFSEKNNTEEFTHSDFAKTVELKGTQVSFDALVNPYEGYLVNDTLLLVSNMDPAQKEKIKIISLNDGKLISSFAQEGHADNELISCNIRYFSPQSPFFYVEDIVQRKYWICSLDSLFDHKKSIVTSFYYSRDVMSIYPLDSTYVGFNFWYLNHDKYNNDIYSPISEYKIGQKREKTRSPAFKYFVANVTGATMARNPHNGDIWVAYNHDNVIQIYDKNMNLKKQMNGPDQIENKYQKKTIKKQEYVFFSKEAYVSCYYMSVSTPKHVYILYENINGGGIPLQPKPVEVFKLDWDGHLLCNYKLDRHAYTISIDSKELCLYATCINNTNQEVQIVKYDLK